MVSHIEWRGLSHFLFPGCSAFQSPFPHVPLSIQILMAAIQIEVSSVFWPLLNSVSSVQWLCNSAVSWIYYTEDSTLLQNVLKKLYIHSHHCTLNRKTPLIPRKDPLETSESYKSILLHTHAPSHTPTIQTWFCCLFSKNGCVVCKCKIRDFLLFC